MTNKDYKIMKLLYRTPASFAEIHRKFKIITNGEVNKLEFSRIGSSDFVKGVGVQPDYSDWTDSILFLTPYGVEIVEKERHRRAARCFDILFGFFVGIATSAFGAWIAFLLK